MCCFPKLDILRSCWPYVLGVTCCIDAHAAFVIDAHAWLEHKSRQRSSIFFVQVSMNGLLEGKGRKDASRWFFEMLVLKTRNYVNLQQEEPYGDISVSATSKLLTAI